LKNKKKGCPISMSHCHTRHPVIAALDAAISCRGIFGSSPKMTLFEK